MCVAVIAFIGRLTSQYNEIRYLDKRFNHMTFTVVSNFCPKLSLVVFKLETTNCRINEAEFF